MPTCEKCWGDAWLMAQNNPFHDQTYYYHKLLEERKDYPCSKEEQIGQFMCPHGKHRLMCEQCKKEKVQK